MPVKGYKKPNSRNNRIQVKLSDEELEKLRTVENHTGLSQTDVVIKGIEMQHKEITEK